MSSIAESDPQDARGGAAAGDSEPPEADGAAGPAEGTEPVGDVPGWVRALQVLVLFFVFLVGVRGLGTGFQGLGGPLLDSVFRATENPFIGLVVGILATTLVQSSSATTSMIVALVAAPENPLPVANAIPMVMGANIGTTVTNTVVSLGHVAREDEFRRAFAAATCHDFFNFLAVGLLLPLEMATGALTWLSDILASAIGSGGPGKFPNPIKGAVTAAVEPMKKGFDLLSDDPVFGAVALLVLSGLIIFGSLMLIVRLLRGSAGARMRGVINRSLGKSPYLGMFVGMVVTVIVQSSSITTAVLVPVAAAGLVRLEEIFPITLGANIGTTLTAIIASMAAPAETAQLAVQVALVHLLFNLVAIALIYPIPVMRRIPLAAARWLANVATRSKRMAVVYVLSLFYGLPGLLIFVSRALG